MVLLGGGGGEDDGSGSPAAAAPSDDVLKMVPVTVEPSGTKARLSAVPEGAYGVAVTLSVQRDGEYVEIARDTAPKAVLDGPVDLTADQEGEAYVPDGGQGLFAIGEDYATYYGWNIRDETVEFFD